MTALTQENEHIRKLIAARDREVEQRRNIADALARAYERGETERMREAFINIQNTIEAIERPTEQEEHWKHEQDWGGPRGARKKAPPASRRHGRVNQRTKLR